MASRSGTSWIVVSDSAMRPDAVANAMALTMLRRSRRHEKDAVRNRQRHRVHERLWMAGEDHQREGHRQDRGGANSGLQSHVTRADEHQRKANA